MQRPLIPLLLLMTLLLSSLPAQEKNIIGYFQSWDWQNNPEKMQPQNIPFEKLTAVTYAFFYPLEDGKIVGMDSVADRFLLEGKSGLAEQNRPSLIGLAHKNGTKVILSIGGWDHSDNFPQVSADPQKRRNFARWCLNHIRHYGFDGIDVDWEFPGYKSHNGTPDDKYNFTLLLQTVRDSLQQLSTKTGRDYLLSASLPAAAGHLPDIQVQKISQILDYLNIMTYDLFGPWGSISNHNSALYGPAKGDSARCVDGAFRLYHQQHHIPAEKINLGMAFYGHSYAGCSEMYSPHQGADTTLFSKNGSPGYAQIAKYFPLFDRRWDQKAQTSYLVSDSLDILVSFDDVESIKMKADYILQKDAAGVIIWPLLGDYSAEVGT
ncbi:MAG: glycosyl hydrolase family 18 protein, partial [Calditrichia bacterium]